MASRMTEPSRAPAVESNSSEPLENWRDGERDETQRNRAEPDREEEEQRPNVVLLRDATRIHCDPGDRAICWAGREKTEAKQYQAGSDHADRACA